MINININHVPTSSKKRTLIAMPKVLAITVHSTGNLSSTAKNERAWLTNSDNKTETGFHYVVDEKEVIECIPPTEVAWHAGDGRGNGNMHSIGVEICESGDRRKTLANAIELIQHLMAKHKVDKVVRHYDWSKKNCPRILNTTGDWKEWNEFYQRVMTKQEIKQDDVSKIKINLNGVIKEVAAINRDGNNYVKLRDLADSKIIIDYDAEKKIPIVTVRA